jgi:hypothetical protein
LAQGVGNKYALLQICAAFPWFIAGNEAILRMTVSRHRKSIALLQIAFCDLLQSGEHTQTYYSYDKNAQLTTETK